MKKKILSVCNVVLAVVMLLSTACQKGGGEESNSSDWLSESEVVSEDSTSEESSSSDSTSEEEKNPNLPEYEPDPVPTEPIEIQPAKISAYPSSYYSLAIDGDGKLWAWGNNRFGALGNGVEYIDYRGEYDYYYSPRDNTTVYTPQEVKTDVRFSSVSAGNSYALAIDTEGNLWGWGQYDTADEGAVQTVPFPTQTFEGRKFVQVEAHKGCSYAIDTEGNLWGWGYNNQGYLGDGTKEYRDTPIQIMPGTKFSYISVDDARYAIDVQGQLWGWGYNSYGLGDGVTLKSFVPIQIMPGTKFIQVSTDYKRSYAIDEGGNLWGWGSGGYLGDGTTKNRSEPVQIMKGKYFTWVSVIYDASFEVSYAIDVQGQLWGWGENINGYLGTGGEKTMYKYPVQIAEGRKFSQITMGTCHSLGLDINGELWTWGAYSFGAMGVDSGQLFITSPVCLMEEREFSKIVGSYAIDTEGNLWEWSSETDTYQQFSDLKAKDVATGDISLAIDTDGKLWVWGTSDWSLGDGVTMSSEVPIQIMEDKRFIQVAAGNTASFALDVDGNLWSWGGNDPIIVGVGNALGLGPDIDVITTPRQVKAGTKFKRIIVSGSVYAIDEKDNLWGWGPDNDGKLLGLSESDNSSDISLAGYRMTPTQVKISYDSVTAIGWVKFASVSVNGDKDGGGYYAIDTDGKLWGWAIPDGLPGAGGTPSILYEEKTFSAIDAGYRHTLAIDTEGRLWTWGYNGYGELGDGTRDTLVKKATEIMPGKRFSYVAAVGAKSYAIDADGKLWAWGNNEKGEIVPHPYFSFGEYQRTPRKVVLGNEN